MFFAELVLIAVIVAALMGVWIWSLFVMGAQADRLREQQREREAEHDLDSEWKRFPEDYGRDHSHH